MLLGLPQHCRDHSCSHCVAAKIMYAEVESADERSLESTAGSMIFDFHESAQLQTGKKKVALSDIHVIDILHQFLNFCHYHINQTHRLAFSDISGANKLGTLLKVLNTFF
eukprot:m.81064 g.81064  ORF g.81064 m.81064 type:complete len:110 (+) comp14562_c0_seq24:639-968(+)